MPPASKQVFSEADLSKGELRKLNALRKSLGEEIADKAFAEWYANRPSGKAVVGAAKMHHMR